MVKRYSLLLAWPVVMGLPSVGWAQPVGPEFQVNTYTTGRQCCPSIASDTAGNFVVVWDSLDQDGSYWGVFGQRYDQSGNPLGGEFQVNTYTTNNQEESSVDSDSSGNFVVVWESPQDGAGDGIFGQRYDNSGNPLGGEFQVNTYTTNSQGSPSVASDSSGNFVVIWVSGEIFGQRYDNSGNPLGVSSR